MMQRWADYLEKLKAGADTVDEWKKHVGALLIGNSQLVFDACVSFAAPLAKVADVDSGGFHKRGSSSIGKTTGLEVAASLWGAPKKYFRTWRATVNGLEGLAALHNDGLLILDEINQIDPKDVGEAAYLLANGQGKARASRTGVARQSARWRILFLSSGEESLSALMARAGKRANAGQEIRLADIPADAGAGMGAIEELHGYEDSDSLIQAISAAAGKFHGAIGPAWLRHIVADSPKLEASIQEKIQKFVSDVVPNEAKGQVRRVARRFGLVAAAGELATAYNLTGWPEGEANKAAKKCFNAWLESFGGVGNREERVILEQVKAYFEAHGASRFEDLLSSADQRVPNRAGFTRIGKDGKTEYLVLPEIFKREICQGLDSRAVAQLLATRGWIIPDKDNKTAQKLRIPSMGTTRCYVFTAQMWENGQQE